MQITQSKTNPELFLGYPDLPANADEKLRLELAQRGKDDFYFFCKSILGYDLLTPHTHAHLCGFIQTCNAKRRMLQMPRSHFKTTIATIGQTIWDIVQNPNIRILLVAQSAPNAERFLLEIQNHILYNDMLRWLYPYIVPPEVTKARWNAREIQVPRDVLFREPTVDSIGSRGAVESRHYDKIRADDIIGEKEFNSQSEMEKTIEWCSGLESLLVSPTFGEIDFIGTRWRLNDVYAFVEKFYGGTEEETEVGPYATKKGALVIFRRQAREDGEPIFPELFTNEFFERLMRENPHRYASQYANNPQASGITLIEKEWLRFYHFSEDQESILYRRPNEETTYTVRVDELDRILVYDPSVAETKTASKSAILILGKHKEDVFVLESRVGHYTPDKAIDYLFELDEKWNLRLLSIEDVAFQKAIKYWMKQRAQSEGRFMPHVRPYKPGSQKSKDERIKGLQPLYRSGRIWYQEGFTDLIEETLAYTFVGRSPQRDALDALAQMLEVFRVHTNEDRGKEIRELWKQQIGLFGPTGYGYKRVRFNT